MTFYLFVSIFTLELIWKVIGNVEECYSLYCGSEENSKDCLSIYSQSHIITLNSCGTNSICPIKNISSNLDHIESFSSSTCTQESTAICDYQDGSRLTGQDCCKHTDCQSEQCGKFGCLGIQESQHCSKDEECDTNLYCTDLGFCYKSYGSDSKGCKRDNQCRAGYGCNFGKCIQYFSLADGKKTEDSKFCESMLKIDDLCDSLSLYLQDEMSYYPYNCSIGESCMFIENNNNKLFTSTSCECDGVNKETGYCGQYIKYLKCISSLISSTLIYDSSNCSGKYSHTDDIDILFSCGSITEEQYNFAKNIYKETENWSLYQSQVIDSCSKSLGLFDPAVNILNRSINHCKKSSSGSALSIKTVVAITITCVLIFFIIVGGLIFWLIKRRRSIRANHIVPQSVRSQYQTQSRKISESECPKLESILPPLIFSAESLIKGDPVCSICLNEIIHNDEIRITLCSHPFHLHCIDEWLRQRNFSASCPNCNENLL